MPTSEELAPINMDEQLSACSWIVQARAEATAGLFNPTLEICRDLPISRLPLPEQQRRVVQVVGEVEDMVSKSKADNQ